MNAPLVGNFTSGVCDPVTLEIVQAYDPMEVTASDLARDLRGELEAEIKLMEALPETKMKELEEEVFSSFRFDLCFECAQQLRKEAKGFFGKMMQLEGPGSGAEGEEPDPPAGEANP